MKKLRLMFLLVMIFGWCSIVNAQKCVYETTIEPNSSLSDGEDIELILNVDEAAKKFDMNEIFGYPDLGKVLDSYINSEWTDEKLINEMDGGCFDEIYLCKLTKLSVPGSGTVEVTAAIINSDLFNYLDNLYTVNKYRMIESLYGFEEDKDCTGAKLNKDKSEYEKIVDSNFKCSKVDSLYDVYSQNYCKNDCTIDNVKKYKDAKQKIISYCNTKLSYGDVGLDPCIDACLNVKDKIAKNEGLDISECGFSGRLISFISNILRWAKYILPVIVIVLGILDFMKAMGADKEDEMKKAQQRFIKRLIAAALLFIVPLILEFVLDKMGFGYDDCGLF